MISLHTFELIAGFYLAGTLTALYRTCGEVWYNWPWHVAQVVQGKCPNIDPVIDFSKYPRQTTDEDIEILRKGRTKRCETTKTNSSANLTDWPTTVARTSRLSN